LNDMASKFMRIKKIVIPLITLVILVSQISGCAIMNRDDAAGILADNDEVVVEYAEPDENAGAEGVAGQIDTSVPEDTSEDLEDAEIGVVDNIGTLDEGDTEGAGEVEQPGEVGETEAPEVEAPETPEVETPVEAEPTYSFTSVNETVYATTTVNIREGFSADTDKVGSLGRGQSVVRTGIGTGDAEGWSKVEFNGQTAYISSDYLSLTKPAAQSSGSNSGSQTSQGSSGGQTSQGSSGGQTQQPSSSGTEHSLDDLANAMQQAMEESNGVGSTTGPLTEETIEGIAGSIELVP
jgi:uncharacterized protein YgiM (DUF1202 family)